MTETVEVVSSSEAEVNPFRADAVAVDVFTHSTTSFPGAWPEEQVTQMLEAWLEVIESLNYPTTSPRNRRVDLVRRVTTRLRRRQVKVSARMVRKEMKLLRTEYRVFQGLVKIGKPTVRADCVDLLDRIFLTRKSESKTSRRPVKEDLQEEVLSQGPIMETIKEAEPQEENKEQEVPGDGETRTEPTDEKSSELSGRNKIQRRQNIRLLVLQQQEGLQQLIKLLQSNSGTVLLLSEIAETLKAQVILQEKILATMSVLIKSLPVTT